MTLYGVGCAPAPQQDAQEDSSAVSACFASEHPAFVDALANSVALLTQLHAFASTGQWAEGFRIGGSDLGTEAFCHGIEDPQRPGHYRAFDPTTAQVMDPGQLGNGSSCAYFYNCGSFLGLGRQEIEGDIRIGHAYDFALYAIDSSAEYNQQAVFMEQQQDGTIWVCEPKWDQPLEAGRLLHAGEVISDGFYQRNPPGYPASIPVYKHAFSCFQTLSPVDEAILVAGSAAIAVAVVALGTMYVYGKIQSGQPPTEIPLPANLLPKTGLQVAQQTSLNGVQSLNGNAGYVVMDFAPKAGSQLPPSYIFDSLAIPQSVTTGSQIVLSPSNVQILQASTGGEFLLRLIKLDLHRHLGNPQFQNLNTQAIQAIQQFLASTGG